jgi:hypothetical protein
MRERISGSLSDWIQSTRALKPILNQTPVYIDRGFFNLEMRGWGGRASRPVAHKQ